ncbi:MAG: Uma2 family endonuclease [Pirellulaceae bacterium]|nr:Uma2 family endonuclease [Pirellulaceae bacterium]
MSTALASKRPLPPSIGNVCGLEAGDHLTRAEFEQRYARQPDLKKAELVEGVVYMPSPVRLQSHATPHSQLVAWAVMYQSATPGTAAADSATVRLDADNEPQPDVLLYVLPSCGGRVRISDDDYLEGAPEWIGEVASSTDSYDLHSKLNAYRRNQVREYLVVLPQQGEVRWFELRADRYELLADQEGILRSRQFPGLWLNISALLAGDAASVLATLRDGLDSPAHLEFVHRLQNSGSS